MVLPNNNFIENHYRGNTWDGVVFTIDEQLVENGPYTPVNLTGVTALMQLRLTENSEVAYEFKSSNNTIIINNPLSGDVVLPPQKVDIMGGVYLFDLQLTFADGYVMTPVRDKWEITNDISRTA